MYATLQAINNYFERTSEYGDYAISENSVSTVRGDYKVGQYVRIMDSLLNDGVYKIATVGTGTITLTETLVDEEFSGYIVGLAIPPELITLSAKVEGFSNAGVSSESIPNYSVSYNVVDGLTVDGATAYKRELAPYRKPFVSRYYFLNRVRIYG